MLEITHNPTTNNPEQNIITSVELQIPSLSHNFDPSTNTNELEDTATPVTISLMEIAQPEDWTAEHTSLVLMTAQGYTIAQLRNSTTFSTQQINRLRKTPYFRVQLAHVYEQLNSRIRDNIIANKSFRIQQKQMRHDLLNQVMMERGEAFNVAFLPTIEYVQTHPDILEQLGMDATQHATFSRLPGASELFDAEAIVQTIHSGFTVPGASTGLLVRTIKIIGTGIHQMAITEWNIDKALIDSLSALEKDTAFELGESSENVTPVQKAFINININQV